VAANQERLHVAQCVLADALDGLGLLAGWVGPAHPGGDHPQGEQVLGDRVVNLPGDPGPFRGARVAGGPLALGGQRGAELAGHGGEVLLQPAHLVPARGRQGDGVVAVRHRQGGLFQAAYPAHQAVRAQQPEQHPDRHDDDEQREGERQQLAGAVDLAQPGPGLDTVDQPGRPWRLHIDVGDPSRRDAETALQSDHPEDHTAVPRGHVGAFKGDGAGCDDLGRLDREFAGRRSPGRVP
jgi:hypothetical protein